jgi:acyl-CoA synthetase (NDP forming)
VGTVWKQALNLPLLTQFGQLEDGPVKVLDEAESKDLLARNGIPVPAAKTVHSIEAAVATADALGYPVVVKALGIAHKTEVGGVRLKLGTADEVTAAMIEMSGLSKSFLIEKMVEGVVVELIVGVARDEQFGPYLIVGAGGFLVELVKDSKVILLPTTRELVLHAMAQLKCADLLNGYRGAPPADQNAAADVILIIAGMVENDPSSIIELDINPLMLLAEGRGVVAADALIRLNSETESLK